MYKLVAISGSGNVAQFAAEKVLDLNFKTFQIMLNQKLLKNTLIQGVRKV